jgi:hypothetical protein
MTPVPINRGLMHSPTKLCKSEEKHRRIVETAGEGFILMDDSTLVVVKIV